MQFKSTIQTDSWLLFLRVGVALFSIVHILSFAADYRVFFSEEGFLQPDVIWAGLDNKSYSLLDAHRWLADHGYQIAYFDLVRGTIGVYVGTLTLLLAGLFTRLSAVLALALQLTLVSTMDAFKYGADYFNSMLLFYCALAPVNRYYSLDNLIGAYRRSRWHGAIGRLLPARTVLRLMQVHICIVYAFSGFEKMLGFNWRNGESIWKVLHNYQGFVDLRLVDSLVDTSVFIILAWSTILVELLYPLMVNLRPLRLPWIAAVTGMHLFIVYSLGLFHFAAIMILFNFATYVIPYGRGFAISARSKARPALDASLAGA